jgi:hypothetical protein
MVIFKELATWSLVVLSVSVRNKPWGNTMC